MVNAALPVTESWFDRRDFGDGLTLISEPHVHELLRGNIWHMRGSARDLLFDTGLGIVSLRAAFPDLFEREPLVVVSHAHLDHIGGLHEFSDRAAHAAEVDACARPERASLVGADYPDEFRAYMAAAGMPLPPLLLDAVPAAEFDVRRFATRPAPAIGLGEGDVIDLGGRRLEVLHLPGHTPGSIALLDAERDALFSGDIVAARPVR
ncbi:MBL fold metallo-hydrolase [Actinomadura formosensis]|uniref:MBL fold metallo-hydrolase n=1 Tax=Actinomadura formosensis TaxID=60706 RepID=UPI00083240BB|nr:MBL fold metallo-hydrolase [Actinomadura formosensis]